MGRSPVKVSVRDGLATVRLGREHGNAIDTHMVDALRDAFLEASGSDDVRGVLLAASGKMFCPGLDLKELIGYDRDEMQDFMGRFGSTMLTLYTFPKPMVAAISGHALAGGCLMALTADRRVLREGSMVGLNEVRVGVPLPYAQALMLRDAIEPSYLEEAALAGRNFTDDEAVRAGFAHEVRPARGFEKHCIELLADMASRDLRAFSTTKRYLRSAALERIRANDGNLRDEFLDCWFSDSTRKRIEELVEQLEK